MVKEFRDFLMRVRLVHHGAHHLRFDGGRDLLLRGQAANAIMARGQKPAEDEITDEERRHQELLTAIRESGRR